MFKISNEVWALMKRHSHSKTHALFIKSSRKDFFFLTFRKLHKLVYYGSNNTRYKFCSSKSCYSTGLQQSQNSLSINTLKNCTKTQRSVTATLTTLIHNKSTQRSSGARLQCNRFALHMASPETCGSHHIATLCILFRTQALRPAHNIMFHTIPFTALAKCGGDGKAIFSLK